MPAPPYQRIANELRRRIQSGELGPGARLPSTRQLARRWHVALATATKALATLQHEGLIHAQPRVGNVVTSAQRAEPGQALTRERIVQAAITLADTEGLAAVSMRAVAAKLGGPTMSLYGHVRDKQDLILLMIDRAFGESALPAEPARDWRRGLEISARAQWALYRRHPWLAQVVTLTRPLALPNLIVHAEWVLRALEGLGLGSASMLQAHMIVFSYVRGLAINLETEAQAEADTGMDERAWNQTQEAGWAALIATGRYPTFAKLLTELAGGFDLDLDATFELGLQPLLDGLNRWFTHPRA